MKKMIVCGTVIGILALAIAARAADGLTQTLQHGLYEEEANQNLDAAIKAYQSVISQSEEQRKVVATALFRLGECYRKLGKTNEATAQYQRIIRDFSEQEQLVKLSGENIAKSGGVASVADAANEGATSTDAKELARIRAMVKDSPDLVNSPSQWGHSQLHAAAVSGWFSVAEFLISHGANVNARYHQDLSTPLHYAARNGHKRIVELLLANGAEVDPRDNYNATPLYLATANGYLGIVQVLLTNKADVNVFGNQGKQPLHEAAEKGYAALAAVLLDHGAELERRARGGAGGTPLHLAADRGRREVLELLLKRNAQVNSKDAYGSTPLHWAARGIWSDIVKILLDAGADPNIRNQKGETALFGISNTQIMEMLLKHKADPNATNAVGRSSLAELVRQDNPVPGAIALLLENGASPNSQDEWGNPVLFPAVAFRRVSVVELLLEHRANPNFLVDAETPLSRAERGLKEESSRLGSDVQARLDWERIAKLLREHGANEDLVRISKITYTRPEWSNDNTWFTRGTNDFNRYTLLELFTASFKFADFAHITLLRLDPATLKAKEIQVDLEEAMRSQDCSKNIPLAWGDRVMIPELDHELNAQWTTPPELRSLLETCLTRSVQIIVKETTNTVKLAPSLSDLPGRSEIAPSVRSREEKKAERTLYSFRLKPVVYGANVLRASSDVTRVRVIRTEAPSKQRKEWTFDLTRIEGQTWGAPVPMSPPLPAPGVGGQRSPPGVIPAQQDLWLLDGDVIEIPEKR